MFRVQEFPNIPLEYQNHQLLFPCTTLTDSLLQSTESVFTVR